MDPALFGGAEDFRRQTDCVASMCRESPPRPGFDRVRLPGESGLRKREEQLKRGVELYASVVPSLAPWISKLGVALPDPVG
jgi:L-lactate dehydrogenase